MSKEYKERKKLVTLMKNDFSNFHLTKDVGMIPYYLMKDYGFDSEIWCNIKDSEVKKYDNLKYTKGLQVRSFKKTNIKYLCFIKGIIKEAKNIDILMLFGPGIFSLVFTIIYKIFNHKGTVYIRADFDIYQKDKFFLINIIKYYFLFSVIDLVSFDSDYARSCFAKKISMFRKKMITISNGFDNYNFKYEFNFCEKSNNIITVGRVGLKQKNNEMFLLVIVKLKNIIKNNNWKIYFIGPIENRFKEKIISFLSSNPDLVNNIFFTGVINNREKLFNYYKNSKIFCLTSIFESGPNVFAEAGYFGNMIISTKVGIYKELMKDINDDINIESNDVNNYAEILKRYMMDEDLLKKHGFGLKKRIEEKYLWDDIINNFNYHLNRVLENKIYASN